MAPATAFLGLLMTGLLWSDLPQVTNSARVLIYPFDAGFNSRIMNMAKIGRTLQEAGHEVSVLLNSVLLEAFRPEGLRVIEYGIPADINIRRVTDSDLLSEAAHTMNSRFGPLLIPRLATSIQLPYCESMLRNTDILKQLKDENYDLLLMDNAMDCGRILLPYLDVPSILYSNFAFYTQPDVIFPVITSFTCDPLVCDTDQMTFLQRTVNFVFIGLLHHYFIPENLNQFQDLRQRYGMNTSLSVYDSFKNSLILENGHFALEFPRALMPNVVMLSGMYYRTEHKPLPDDMNMIIKSSPYSAVVVVSFGTLVPQLGPHLAAIMARAFAKLPAEVFWRFTGEKPVGLGDNTHLVGWFPQSDLLADPRTTLFVTHCGISSVFEAAQNGVPVVSVPLFFDQNANAAKLVRRARMGVVVDIKTLNDADFQRALFAVFDNATYRENARRVSRLVNDHDMEPTRKLLYWVDFVLRHGGVDHLVSYQAHHLGVLRFYSVDVVLFLLFLALCLLGFIVGVGVFTFRMCRMQQKKKAD